MGFHFCTRFFHFRRNSPLIRNLPLIFSPFSTLSAENPFYPNSFAHIFQQCSKNKANEPGRQAHARMIVSGFKPTVFYANCLLQMYVKSSHLECASKVFDRMPQRDCVSWTTMMFGYAVNGKMGLAQSLFDLMPERDVFSWTSMISGYIKNGNILKSIEVFVMMGRDAVAYDGTTLSLVLKACASLEDDVLGVQLHGVVVKLGFGYNVVIVSALMSMYANCRMFNETHQIYVGMLRSGMEPNDITYSTVLKACAGGEALQHGREIHGRVIKCGFGFNLVTASALMSMYANCIMFSESLKIYVGMLRSGMEPDDITYSIVLKACAGGEALQHGRAVHGRVIKCGAGSNLIVSNIMIDMYCKCGVLEEAEKLHERMKEQTLVSWSAMIYGYSSNGQSEKAHKYFSRMLEIGIEPDDVTYLAVLGTCSNLGDDGLGKQIHGQIIKQSMQSDLRIINALVDMYSKCGNMQDSILMFRKSSNHDVVTWSSMVCAYARHGRGNEALQVFEEMLLEKVTPNHATFTGVLHACAHIGLVDKALHYFQRMKDEFWLEPEIKQYSCMVDALGRSGRIMDALKLIQVMPLKANVDIWTSLLSNCKMHGDVKVAEIAARNLLRLDPRCSACYVLLSQTYADAGMWDEASKTRSTMASLGLKNRPGLSNIVESSI